VQVVLSMHPSRVKEFSSWLHRQCADDSLGDSIAKQIDEQGHGARLVVIDPEDREQVARLVTTYNLGACEDEWIDGMQAALRSLVGPPKPEEPQGLGAVVEDADGAIWTRVATYAAAPWYSAGATGVATNSCSASWSRIDVARVLSDGWTPDASGGAS
jgi:hypothetical protein